MNSLTVLVLFAVVALAACAHTKDEKKAFADFCKQHNKRYNSHEEREKAFDNFLKNKEKIDAHNKLYNQGKVKFHLALWEHADLSPEQMKERIAGGTAPNDSRKKRQNPSPKPYPTYSAAPDAIDWRDMGLVGPVEKQSELTMP